MLGQGLIPHMTTTPEREIIAAKHMGRRRTAVFREQTDPPFSPKEFPPSQITSIQQSGLDPKLNSKLGILSSLTWHLQYYNHPTAPSSTSFQIQF